MEFPILSSIPFLLVASGTVAGIGLTSGWQWVRRRRFYDIGNEIIKAAERRAEERMAQLEIEIKQRRLDIEKESEEAEHKGRSRLENEQIRLQQREDKLEARMALVEKKLSDIDKKEAVLLARRERLDEERKVFHKDHEALLRALETVSGLTSQEARDALIHNVDHQVRVHTANLTRRLQAEAVEHAEKEAQRIISTAIGRLAVSCISESAVITVPLPSDDMKGRVIGREGRNIRALEQATGVNFIIDETPCTVVISGFDPIRKQVAKMTLHELVQDGRIHPTRIEEAVERSKVLIRREIKEAGEDAATRAGVMDLHPEIIMLLGKLKFRYSYGQNVLEHSLEVSSLMRMMAEELGLDSALAKRIGLLHDMGKALSHEIEGSHAIIGAEFARRYGEIEEVANGIGCHHQEVAPITIEGSLCSAADAVSASRPGGRIEAVEQYVKRLQRLEELAMEYPEVDKAYALQAGREVRVVVTPDSIDDDGVINLSRNLAQRIEKELRYPGRIKVTVIREKRVVEYAM